MNIAIFTVREVRQMLAALAIFVLVLTSVQGLFVAVAQASHTADPINDTNSAFASSGVNITLCHAAGGSGNYTVISPSIDSVIDGSNSGHTGNAHANDIIPAFYYDNNGTPTLFHGQNWTLENADIFDSIGGGQGSCAGDGVVNPIIDLTITKEASNTTPDENEQITYTIIVTNNGTDSATNVVVTDTIPTGTTYVSANPAPDSTGPLTWNFASIAATANETIEVTVTVDSDTGGDTIQNTATAGSDEADDNETDNTVTEDITVNVPVTPTAELKLVKVVNNNFTGTLNPVDFDLSATGGDGTYNFQVTGDNASFATVEADVTYTLTESDETGYALESLVCVGGTQNGNQITLTQNTQVTCTFTNNDIAPDKATLKIVKKLITDNGGTESETDFQYSIDGGTTFSNFTGVTTTLSVDPGTYSVVEDETTATVLGRYDVSYEGCTDIVLAANAEATCIITNDDIAPTITVTKSVDNGTSASPKVAGDFTLQLDATDINDTAQASTSFSGETTGTVLSFDAGSFAVTEPNHDGYTVNIDAACSGTADLGDTIDCQVTNTYIEPTSGVIEVVKEVTKGSTTTIAFDFSGDLGDFSLFPGQSTSTVVTVANGPFAITEADVTGWTLESAVCLYEDASTSTASAIDVPAGETVTCTFTNDQNMGNLIVRKVIDGGTATTTDFSFYVQDANTTETALADTTFAASGENEFTLYEGIFDVRETANTGVYLVSYDNCTTVSVTQTQQTTPVCTITNTFPTEPTYLVFGFVWEESGTENDEFDGGESPLVEWKVTATNAANSEEIYTTFTDTDGYYEFYLPEGDWILSETVEGDYTQSFPNDAGNHLVFVTVEDSSQSTSILQTIFNFVIPTAHAQAAPTFGPFNFGNVFTGGGGGGGSSSPSCSVFDISDSSVSAGDEVTLTWETRRGTNLSIAANGSDIYDTNVDAEIDNGSLVVTVNETTEYTLTVSRGSRSRTCSVDVVVGSVLGASTDRAIPMVLGDQVGVVPVGAPNTGSGGAAPVSIPNAQPFVAALGLRADRYGR